MELDFEMDKITESSEEELIKQVWERKINESKGKRNSPLENIKGIKTSLTMDDILDAIRESRAR